MAGQLAENHAQNKVFYCDTKFLALTLKDDDNNIMDQQVCASIFIIYLYVFNFSDDVEFMVSFLPVCQLFDFTRDQEEDMFKQWVMMY